MNLIEVVSVSEIKTAKTGRAFKTVTFKELDKQVQLNGKTINVKSNNPNRTRNIWDEGATEDGVAIKADPLYDTIKVGDVIEGAFHTVSTTDYTIGSGEYARTVNVYSCVVFSNEDATKYINRQLKNVKANVVDTTPASMVPSVTEKAF